MSGYVSWPRWAKIIPKTAGACLEGAFVADTVAGTVHIVVVVEIGAFVVGTVAGTVAADIVVDIVAADIVVVDIVVVVVVDKVS
jgi:hypothetical protein